MEQLKHILDAIERAAFDIPAPNRHTPYIVGLVVEARRVMLPAEKLVAAAEQVVRAELAEQVSKNQRAQE